MPGYHNDQFFRINDPTTGENTQFNTTSTNYDGAGWAISGADNPPFIYPDRTVRTEGPHGQHLNTILQRGYIRSLTSYGTAAPGALAVHKCQFQFNPATLTQVVEAASNTLDFLHLDPSQYAVPKSASVNFIFELLFDRSMEMNNGKNGPGEVIPDANRPWQDGDPGQVGVLRDLAAFYGVIGQAIRSDQRDYMLDQLNDQIDRQASSERTGLEDDTTDATLASAKTNLPAYLDNNAANSAFLLPVPVRVMFSSLYIVEGFVTNTTVAFTKFNTAMVPMQCALTVTMEAKYIGFAQANTFLQWALNNQAAAQEAEDKAAAETTNSYYSAFSKTVTKMTIKTLTASNDTEMIPFDFVNPTGTSSEFAFKVYVEIPSATGKDDAVGNLFGEAEPPSITVLGSFNLYGPYLTAPASNTQSALGNFARGNGRVIASGTLLNTNAKYSSATTADEWDKLVSGTRTDPPPFFATPNEASYVSPTAEDDGDDPKWFIINWVCNTHAKIGDQDIIGHGEAWQLVKNLDWATQTTLAMNWPDAPVEVTNTLNGGTVPPDNAATTPPTSGDTSNVGGGGGGTRSGGFRS